MENKDREYRKFKFGLALKKVMDQSKENDPDNANEDARSFRKIERASGIRHASIVQIVNGKKNASWSTIDAILEGLEMTLTQFAAIYDALTNEEVLNHKKGIEKKKVERENKRKLNSKTAAKKELPNKKIRSPKKSKNKQ